MGSKRKVAHLLGYCSFAIVCYVSFIELSNMRVKRSAVNEIYVAIIEGALYRDTKNISDIKAIPQNRTLNLQETDSNGTITNITKVALNISELETSGLPDLVEPKNWARNGYKSALGDGQVISHCDTCAIVTSSGHLLGSNAGPEIDDAECVIRMNAAPIGKYVGDVGQRTTFRVIGHRNFPRMFDKEAERQYYFVTPATKSEAIVTAWLYAVNVDRNIETILSNKYAKRYKNVQFYLTTQEQMMRNERLFYQMLDIDKPIKKPLWMSTGWTTMLFALEVCDHIHVYGMTYEEYCMEHPHDRRYYHYFDKVRRACDYFKLSENKITNGHKFLTEKLSFALWASKYNITFHHPSWEGHIPSNDTEWESPYHRSFLEHQSNLEKTKKLHSSEVSNNKNETEPVKGQEQDPEEGQEQGQEQGHELQGQETIKRD